MRFLLFDVKYCEVSKSKVRVDGGLGWKFYQNQGGKGDA
jgi:hypothetical protein